MWTAEVTNRGHNQENRANRINSQLLLVFQRADNFIHNWLTETDQLDEAKRYLKNWTGVRFLTYMLLYAEFITNTLKLNPNQRRIGI